MADDQGWGDTSYNGHPVLKTPNLDAMARSGIRFDRFYAGAPVCSPTRGSCLTGRHPFRYGIFFANADTGTDAPSKYILPSREITVAELVKPLGYATGHFGKWHLGDFQGPQRSAPTDNGFDEFFSTTRKVPTVDPDGYWTAEGRIAGVMKGDDSELLMSRALDFIRGAARRKQPFLAVVWFHAPHVPFLALPRHRSAYSAHAESRQHYWGSIAAIDEQMGRLRSTLDEIGIRRDTMLWYASDNGPEGDREEDASPGSSGPWRGRKRSLFEGGVRVPGLLEWPNRLPQARAISTAASTSDYFPTIRAALGIEGGKAEMDGVNLFPFLRGPDKLRESPLGFETIGNTRGSPRLAYIEDRWKLLSNLDGSPDLLFDLARDPGETANAAEREPAQASRMRSSLEQWRQSCTASRSAV
ncbi:MAG: sulfatase-like hydrolase/transferase [Bryobacter sp.]|nr:sulfatase-like hydrolase/transferase [Bryobacter sp.]